MVTVPVFDSTTPPRYRREPSEHPVYGRAALELDLRISIAAALDAVLADAAADRRRVLGVGELPWCQLATSAY